MSGNAAKAYFHCFLEPAPQPLAATAEGLVVDSRLWWQPGPSIPLDLFRRASFRERFLPGYPLVWVEDPRTAMLNPFWVPRHWWPVLSALKPRECAPPLDPEIASALCSTGILLNGVRLEQELADWQERLACARAQFARVGYANLSGVLHPAQRGALASYYRRLTAAMKGIGDTQCAGRYGVHNEFMARFIGSQLASLVEQVAAEGIMPSYAYFAGYRPGAVLSRHTDREQCEFSVSLLIDYEPALGATSPWPLCLETPDGAVRIHQAPGDALVYRGRQVPHWRPELPPAHRSDSLLLHYVRRDFSGPLR